MNPLDPIKLVTAALKPLHDQAGEMIVLLTAFRENPTAQLEDEIRIYLTSWQVRKATNGIPSEVLSSSSRILAAMEQEQKRAEFLQRIEDSLTKGGERAEQN